jgi:hypothetical protein
MKKLVSLLLSIVAAQILCSDQFLSDSIFLEWDPNTEPDLAGYRMYYGALDSTLFMLDVGLTTSVVISNLQLGLTYRFYATAYNTSGLESGPSEEIIYTVPVTSLIDSDEDGLPDTFELANGLNPLSARDAAADTDGDHLTNLEEFVAGTDPANRKSTLRLSLFLPRTGGMGIQFASVAGQVYTVEANDKFPEDEWFPLRTEIEGTGEAIQTMDSTWNFSVRRVYRVTTAGKEESGILPALLGSERKWVEGAIPRRSSP